MQHILGHSSIVVEPFQKSCIADTQIFNVLNIVLNKEAIRRMILRYAVNAISLNIYLIGAGKLVQENMYKVRR